MINREMFLAINAFAEDKGLDKNDIFQAIEKGLLNAYKKESGVANARIRFEEEKGEYYFYQYYNVVATEEELIPEDPSYVTLAKAKTIKRTAKVGDYFEVIVKTNPKEYGRIAINSIKQIMNQEIKKCERENAYNFFKEHEDEMIVGIVSSVNDDTVFVDLGHDTVTPIKKYELSRDNCKVGSRVNLYLSKVEMTTKGPRVFASRSDKNLIKRLFETYIPEIQDGTVEIIGIARDSGDRTKVCVKANDPNVDPVGACLGAKGKRIKDVLDSLDGEKIDIYEYSENPADLITNALKPAEIIWVNFDQKEKSAVAVTPDDCFSLAIGKKGQNVKLAVQSCGWKIDIKSVSQAQEEGIDF